MSAQNLFLFVCHRGFRQDCFGFRDGVVDMLTEVIGTETVVDATFFEHRERLLVDVGEDQRYLVGFTEFAEVFDVSFRGAVQQRNA